MTAPQPAGCLAVERMEQDKILHRPDGVDFFYRVSLPDGNDSSQLPTLILIHGVASNLTRWTEFLLNTILCRHCRIIRPDLRGHSRSQTDIGVGMKNWCRDIVALLDEERVSQAWIVGHSLGAQVALHLAWRYPARIAGMVLIDPVIPAALTGYLALGPYLRYLLGLFANIVSLCRRLGFGRRKFEIRDLYELDQATRQQINDDPDTDLAELYHSPSLDMQFIPVSNYVRDMCEVVSPLPPLEQLKIPALALLARDPSVSNGTINRRVMARMPNLEIETIDADHWPLTEKPDETRQAIERWCLRQWQGTGKTG